MTARDMGLGLEAHRQATTGDATLAGVCFFLLAAGFMTAIMAAASMAPGYDIGGGAISDLGLEPATAWLFNGALLLVGALNIAGGVILYLRDRRALPLALYVIAGMGAIGAGAITLATPGIHGIFALVAFVFFNLQIVPAALGLGGPMRAIGLVLSAVGLAYVAVMFVGDAGNPAVFGAIGHGGTERMIVYPPMIWLMAYGGYLMAPRQAT